MSLPAAADAWVSWRVRRGARDQTSFPPIVEWLGAIVPRASLHQRGVRSLLPSHFGVALFPFFRSAVAVKADTVVLHLGACASEDGRPVVGFADAEVRAAYTPLPVVYPFFARPSRGIGVRLVRVKTQDSLTPSHGRVGACVRRFEHARSLTLK